MLFLINYVENLWIVSSKLSLLKLKIYGNMCIFMIGLLDVGYVTHDVFLAIYLLALTVQFYNSCCGNSV